MKNMKLSNKLIGGFCVVVLLMVILVVFNMSKLSELRQLQDTGASRAANAVEAMESAGMGPRLYQIVADAIINSNLAKTRTEWTKIQTEMISDLIHIEKLAETAKEKAWVATAKTAHTTVTQIVEKELFPMLEKSAEVTDEIRAMDGKTDDQLSRIAIALTSFSESQTEASKEADVVFDKVMSRNIVISLSMGGAISVIALLMGIFLTRAITKPLNRAIDGLNEGADQVASAASQVSSASQILAQGSSEQAASIEETSSSLEEMSSMTKQNASNAGQADSLMKEANQVVNKANTSMSQLTTSMQEITKASEETSKIIKTIDEIAFQTNLLALNAAVEAARAGEAGAGFAVVADEVRNLAMRAADAAKNTAALIESTVKKVSEGTLLVKTTNDAFKDVALSSRKVGELVGEIAAASNEQAQGIEQVNIAVTEMDKVTQQNAATAEESASASEELNAQAEEMKRFVADLAALVGGNAAVSTGGLDAVRSPKKAIPARRAPSKALSVVKKSSTGKSLMSQRSKEVHPNDIILMDDYDFKGY
jgi:methyl-accepting chemotaxis protein